MQHWPLTDLVALSLVGKLTHTERIRLVEASDSLDEVLHQLGVIEMNVREEATSIITESEQRGVRIVSFWDNDYPAALRQIDTPPFLLHVLGSFPNSHNAVIAVVGTRACTVGYGKPTTEVLVKRWVRAGCVIVSGLANGIDTLAHESCLRNQGCTIAVVASGIGRITPLAARNLTERIVAHGGAVVSEHPLRVAALPPFFPARNRIIAGMSNAIVVVESKVTGGALITAAFARKQGKPVWAVPGPINSTRSQGCNQLIQSGQASILVSADDVLTGMGTDCNSLFLLSEPPSRNQTPSKIIDLLGGDPVGIDAIAAAWHCSTQEAMVQLVELEMEGMIRQLPGARYVVSDG